GEDRDPALAATADLARHRDTCGLDLPVGDPAVLERLQAELAELHRLVPLRHPGAAAALLLAVLETAWEEHQASPSPGVTGASGAGASTGASTGGASTGGASAAGRAERSGARRPTGVDGPDGPVCWPGPPPGPERPPPPGRPPPPPGRPPPPPRGGPPRSVLGRASLIFKARPPSSLPLSAAIAFSASAESVISTKAKPRERPVSRSVTMLTCSMAPWGSNSARNSASVVLWGMLPTNSFFMMVPRVAG